MLNKELMAILACPACRKAVKEQGREVVCRGCGRRYPVRDGIPVMLVDEARRPKLGKGKPKAGGKRVKVKGKG